MSASPSFYFYRRIGQIKFAAKQLQKKQVVKFIFAYILLLVIPFSLFAQGDEIIGKWKFPGNSREIEIYLENNKYYGKIIKTSGKNKNEKIGHIMLKDFIYNHTDMKYTGKINSPSGMTASGELLLLNENELKISVRKFFIHKTYILTRVK